jgi:hypothetical protein
MHRTQLFIPDEMHAVLKKEAEEQGVTLSEYVRNVLDDHLLHQQRYYSEQGIQTLMRMTEDT